VFDIFMAWFEGELVCYLVYLYPFAFLLHFLHTPKLTLIHTTLYLDDYVCHYARVSRNEM
jgi:hypothetical protein